MKHTSRRRATTALVTFAAVAGTLLAAGGAASAATNPEAGRTAVVASHSSYSGAHGDDRGDRRDHRSDYRDEYRHRRGDDRGDRRDHRGEHRGEHRGDRRWDGHRTWEWNGRYWYSDDHGVRYRCDGVHFYRWDRDVWILVTTDTHDTHRFDIGFFR